ncbi:nucleotidyltransferase family protein [Sphingobium sp. CR28]|uniref:nucleotidyltransferase family protein n=1 Tax=Sphingobium sp. CR28 TaxID=3400272 RepID=UPI003FF03470
MIEPATVALLLLAAGQSKRFGTEDKLLAPLDGVPLGLHVATRLAAMKLGWRIAICREESPLIESLTGLDFDIVINRDPGRGLSSSLALGIERAEAVGADAALVVLADMPFVTPRHFVALLASFDPDQSSIVASSGDSVAMPPALFGRAYFDRLRAMQGDKGGRALFSDAKLVRADPAELRDIDHPEDIS